MHGMPLLRPFFPVYGVYWNHLQRYIGQSIREGLKIPGLTGSLSEIDQSYNYNLHENGEILIVGGASPALPPTKCANG